MMVDNLKKRLWIVLANSSRKWIGAQIFLAWVGFVHYLRRLVFWKPRAGLEQFKANYFSEGYLPVSPQLRAIAHEPMRCTTCGLCDVACPEGFSPMRWLVGTGFLHQTPFHPVESINCLSCKRCEEACPEDIPIIQYVQLASKTYYAKS